MINCSSILVEWKTQSQPNCSFFASQPKLTFGTNNRSCWRVTPYLLFMPFSAYHARHFFYTFFFRESGEIVDSNPLNLNFTYLPYKPQLFCIRFRAEANFNSWYFVYMTLALPLRMPCVKYYAIRLFNNKGTQVRFWFILLRFERQDLF